MGNTETLLGYVCVCLHLSVSPPTCVSVSVTLPPHLHSLLSDPNPLCGVGMEGGLLKMAESSQTLARVDPEPSIVISVFLDWRPRATGTLAPELDLASDFC